MSFFPPHPLTKRTGPSRTFAAKCNASKPARESHGHQADLEIIGLLAKEMGANIGVWLPDKVFEEIRKSVRGYNIPLPVYRIRRGGADRAVNGRVPVDVPAGIDSVRGRHPVHVRVAGSIFQDVEFGTRKRPAHLYQGK